MIIGIPKEKMIEEYRVAATPAIVGQIIDEGHAVLVETGAGEKSGSSDQAFEQFGATIIDSEKELWDRSDLIYKVKNPIEEEFQYFREGLMIFCYLHLANNRPLMEALIENKVIAIGYETVVVDDELPLLRPMSEIGGIMSVVEGSNLLKIARGGKGKTLMGMPGVPPGHVVVIGDGTAGRGAIRTAVGMGARVTVVGRNIKKLAELQDIYGARLESVYSNPENIKRVVKSADLLIGAALLPGAKAPKLVTEEMVKSMEPGSVIVDISVDQGGIIETIDRYTTHSDPTYIKHGVLHYAVPNIPGSVPATATRALSTVTSPVLRDIARLGWQKGSLEDNKIKTGINTAIGYITNKGVAKAFESEYKSIEEII